MTYLLDTNILSAHLRRPSGLQHRFVQHAGRLPEHPRPEVGGLADAVKPSAAPARGSLVANGTILRAGAIRQTPPSRHLKPPWGNHENRVCFVR